jgi:large repetitive protein
VVLKLPNALADASPDTERPQLAIAGGAARVVLIGLSGQRLSDVRIGLSANSGQIVIPRGTERIVVIGLGLGSGNGAPSGGARPGLAGWHAGLLMPYVGWSSAVGPGCVVQSNSDRLKLHRERADAGWINGTELASGVSTVTTTFADAPRCVVIVLDDPASGGQDLGGRQLLLGLDGAERATDAAGTERAPVLLAMDNRSVLAYDVLPQRDATGLPLPVVVAIASQDGWSLVGVMASSTLDAQGAISLIAARGLDAALLPLVSLMPSERGAGETAPASRLSWIGPQRSTDQRRAAQGRASGVAQPAAVRALRAETKTNTTATATPRRQGKGR